MDLLVSQRRFSSCELCFFFDIICYPGVGLLFVFCFEGSRAELFVLRLRSPQIFPGAISIRQNHILS